MQRYSFSKIETIGFWALALFQLVYMALRAVYVPPVHDEVMNYIHYISTFNFMPPFAHWDANNHVLFSALAATCNKLLGAHPWVWRLPGLLALPLFFVYVYKLASLLENKAVRWLFILGLGFSYGFVEWFALARGYGLSMGLLMPTLWYVFSAMQHYTYRNVALATLLGVLATFANLSTLNLLLMLLGLLGLRGIVSLNNSKIALGFEWKKIATIIAIALPGLVFFVWYSFKLKGMGLLYYGKGDSFWWITISTLIEMFLDYYNSLTIGVFYAAMACFWVLLGLFVFRLRWSYLFTPSTLFPLLFVGATVAVLVLKQFMKVNYPEDRVGIYFLPLLVGSIAFLADGVARLYNKKILIILALPLLALPLANANNLNTTHTAEWTDQHIAPAYLNYLAKLHQNPDSVPTVAMYSMQAMAYTISGKYYNSLFIPAEMVNRYSSFIVSDYVLFDSVFDNNLRKTHQKILTDPTSSISLYKRIKPQNWQVINADTTIIRHNKPVAEEYIPLITLQKADFTKGDNAYYLLEVSGFMDFEEVPKDVSLAMDFGVPNSYYRIFLTSLKADFYKGKKFKFNIILPSFRFDTIDKFIAYIWNSNKAPLKATQLQCRVLTPVF